MPQTHVRHDFNETLHEFRDLTEVAKLDTAFGALAEKGRAYLLAEGIKCDDHLRPVGRFPQHPGRGL